MPLESRVAIITGGARGIGRACVEAALEARAAGVVIADVDLEAAAALQRALDPAGARLLPIGVDVTRRADLDRCVEAALARFGRIDILVNNAGIAGRPGTLETIPEAELDRIIAINIKGVWNGCAAVHPIMARAGQGRIINIASIAGKEGNPGLAAYSMTKAAVIGLTKAYAKEVAQQGILVHSVAPAVIETEILAQVAPEVRQYMVSKIPMGRTGRPQEVAALVVFLASTACSFSTGACWDISGGRATY